MESTDAGHEVVASDCPPHDVRTHISPLWSGPKDRGGVHIGQTVIRCCSRCPWEDVHQCAFGDDGDCDHEAPR